MGTRAGVDSREHAVVRFGRPAPAHGSVANRPSARRGSAVPTVPGLAGMALEVARQTDLLEWLDVVRLDVSARLDPERRAELGQFFTPPPTARLMASMLAVPSRTPRLLDAGAGVGSLTAAFVADVCARERRPERVSVVAYELDPILADRLADTLDACRIACERVGIGFDAELRREDFIEAAVASLRADLFASPLPRFDCAILNPPYRKINSGSRERRLLRAAGIETSNLYTAFLALVAGLLAPGGEMVAITPRSFCNGSYFRTFRRSFLAAMALRRVHVFDARDRAFGDDDVLQEMVIFRAEKGATPDAVTITTSTGPDTGDVQSRDVEHAQVVRPDDPDAFIWLVTDGIGSRVAERMARFTARLDELGLAVSTGRVVEFRASEFLRDEPGPDTAPLIYPGHFDPSGFVRWPKRGSRKPNALAITPESEGLLVSPGAYVLTRRFSAKEERRRVIAVVYDPTRMPPLPVGFENHLNYFHRNGAGLPTALAKGLAVFLNSTLVDAYFRQFNGHTQVNATDLRSLRYPSLPELQALGERIGDEFPAQSELDRLIDEGLFGMTDGEKATDPVAVQRRIDEARLVLANLAMPPAQQNVMCALTLLALLDLTPEKPWSEAQGPMRGIHTIMRYSDAHYGTSWAENTRESFRKDAIHYFETARLIVKNPDDPSRPTNSGRTVYQVTDDALALLRTFGTDEWAERLPVYLETAGTLADRYAARRTLTKVSLKTLTGRMLTLSPGKHSDLIEQIVTEFAPRFTPGGTLIYAGDTGRKWASYFDEATLGKLGVTIGSAGTKMPDVVIYHDAKHWLVVVEAFVSVGPIDPLRKEQLERLFAESSAPLVFVTAFPDRRAMARQATNLAWETDVWIAEAPDHLIHYNGERFLGPYE